MKLIVRTSDTNQFRNCRVAWDFGSKVRLNFEYARGIEPLDFGSAVHEGMEVIYDPKRWREPRDLVYTEAKLAFVKWMRGWRKRMRDTNTYDPEQEARWEELVDLGKAMIDHYSAWSPEHDKDWEPKFVEIEFELPIPVSDHMKAQLPDGWARSKDGYLLKRRANGKWMLVVLQGRIDLVVATSQGLYVVDHKTAAQFKDNTTYFDKDAQAGRYCWAAWQLGIPVQGAIFNQLRKKKVVEPEVLQSGGLSKNKAQKTTPELYRQRLRERNLPLSEYEGFLSYFEGQEYFRRIPTYRSPDEMDAISDELVMEAIDMYTNPFIYRNPGERCNWCQFAAPCQMRFDGSDWMWHLESSGNYRRRN